MKRKTSQNLTDIKKLARNLANQYKHRDIAIGLVGNLGAGKTTFTKNFAGYFGIKKIKSPTFIIGSRYKINKKTLYHFDFYRLNHESELASIELLEIFKSKNRIILIEWVDKFPKIAKMCDIQITFKVAGKNLRDVTIR